jgi:ABC transport system ATP-binding/permease protein
VWVECAAWGRTFEIVRTQSERDSPPGDGRRIVSRRFRTLSRGLNNPDLQPITAFEEHSTSARGASQTKVQEMVPNAREGLERLVRYRTDTSSADKACSLSATRTSDCAATTTAPESTEPTTVLPQQDLETACLTVEMLGFRVDGRTLLSDVSLCARKGSLTAIIGPSGAGKSTLAKIVAGVARPTDGDVTFDGRGLHAEYALLRHRIGLVPQDDVVHQQLTIKDALRYAAELRLPAAAAAERRNAVRTVLDELELTDHAHKRVDRVSGGQRKRVSVAMELLTAPTLLVLDEPTTGLDPALDRQVMSMLRRLADAGRVVVVVTHCVTHLDLCDQVLLLTSGGKTGYCGPPDGIASTMGFDDWADIFSRVGSDPEAVHQEFVARSAIHKPAGSNKPAGHNSCGLTVKHRRAQQVSTVVRRQFRLILADRGYLAFLAMLPFVLGALALMVPGSVGLGVADPRGAAPNEPAQIIMLLNTSAVFMGMALSIRDLVGERGIFYREQAVGLSASAYLCAKVVVYIGMAAAQTAVLTAIVLIGKGGPTQGAVVAGSPVAELYLTLAATAVVSAMAGMALSAMAKSQDQILPMLVIAVMLSMVFSGGLIPVTGRPGLDQISWLLPARWGFAASASTVDLRHIAPLTPANEPLWAHAVGWWLFDAAVLLALGAACTAITRWRLRLQER